MRRPASRRGLPALIALLCIGCAPKPPDKPPGITTTPRPAPSSPRVEADPELAALAAIDRGVWGRRRDRWGSIIVPLAAAERWTRVRLLGYPTRVAFRLTDEHYAIVAVWYRPAGGPDDPESCLTRFLAEARPAAEAYGVRATQMRLLRTLQQGATSSAPMAVEIIDATVEGTFETKQYVGALASYSAWPGTCLLQGFVVVADNHRDVAVRIRDRWVAEGAPRLARASNLGAAPPTDAR